MGMRVALQQRSHWARELFFPNGLAHVAAIERDRSVDCMNTTSERMLLVESPSLGSHFLSFF